MRQDQSRRASLSQRAAHLVSLPLFRGLSAPDLERIAGAAHECRYAAGEYICRRGEPGEELYVITHGSVLVKQGDRIVATQHAGEVVGELAVLDRRPRSADLVAAERLCVLVLGGEEFHRLLRQGGDLVIRLLEVLAGRVRDTSARQERVDQLVRAYRERGHVLASLDPLGRNAEAEHAELAPAHYGLGDEDLDGFFTAALGGEVERRPLREIIARLRDTYCGALGVQYMHIDDLEVQHWLRERLEDPRHRKPFCREAQLRILAKLTDAEVFESFLQRKFVGAKRFSLEGAETLIPLLDRAIEKAGELGVEEIVLGMAHRGRLNVLANVLEKPAGQIFREFEDSGSDRAYGMGDVKYHKGFAADRVTAAGRRVHLSLCFNPSHLEIVGTVVMGRVRADQDRLGDGDGSRALALVVHGDAAFAGQGVVQELFNLSRLPGYTTGGAIHVIVNNQIGFTTPPEQGRSSQYATDVARMLQIPVFHVNGEQPEAVERVIQLALEFRDAFRRDVVIDMYCYRRHGHNEGDEPAFTQPLLYAAVERREPLRLSYARNLIGLGEVTEDEAQTIATASRERLERALRGDDADAGTPPRPGRNTGLWSAYAGGSEPVGMDVDTGIPRERLTEWLQRMATPPPDFSVHPRVARALQGRRAMALSQRRVDWGAAEALAFASLLAAGVPVRLSGQDSQRGTFAHRHGALHDAASGAQHVPLAQFAAKGAFLHLLNSPLSEAGVLGFEFGYSLNRPDALVIWEAQFGDFANGAQVIIDQFVTSSEEKWNRLSGLTLLLPHGFEGQGPEHSHARPERFLQLAVADNIQVVGPTTAAQLFHCLRRQVLRPWRKPLVVLTPKALLQHPCLASPLEDLAVGCFQPVIADDRGAGRGEARAVFLCSGKIYHELNAERARRGGAEVDIVRLEQPYPFPGERLQSLLDAYPADVPLTWVQEEPRNMGIWPFVRERLAPLLGQRPLHCVARRASASPATGSPATHRLEQAELLRRALESARARL